MAVVAKRQQLLIFRENQLLYFKVEIQLLVFPKIASPRPEMTILRSAKAMRSSAQPQPASKKLLDPTRAMLELGEKCGAWGASPILSPAEATVTHTHSLGRL